MIRPVASSRRHGLHEPQLEPCRRQTPAKSCRAASRCAASVLPRRARHRVRWPDAGTTPGRRGVRVPRHRATSGPSRAIPAPRARRHNGATKRHSSAVHLDPLPRYRVRVDRDPRKDADFGRLRATAKVGSHLPTARASQATTPCGLLLDQEGKRSSAGTPVWAVAGPVETHGPGRRDIGCCLCTGCRLARWRGSRLLNLQTRSRSDALATDRVTQSALCSQFVCEGVKTLATSTMTAIWWRATRRCRPKRWLLDLRQELAFAIFAPPRENN
jgi:hypothetical protein